MRRWALPLIILLSLGLTLFGLLRPRPDPGTPVTVREVTQGRFAREVSGSALVEAETYTLNFSRSGRVARVGVREGEAVQAGQVLAELEISRERGDLAAAQAQLFALQARLQASRAEAEATRENLRRQLEGAREQLALTRRLFAAGAASRIEVDNQSRQVAQLEGQLESALAQAKAAQRDLQAQLEAQQAQIQSLQRAIAEAQLRAPVAGIVTEVGIKAGESSQSLSGASASAPAGGIRIVRDGSMRVRVRLPEAQALEVRPGMPARVELDALPGQPLVAKVERLSSVAEVQGQGGSAVLPVFLRFTEGAQAVKPGFTGTARVIVLSLPQATLIPLETLVEEGDRSFVWLVDPKTQTVQRRPVTVRARNLTQAAVEGVSPGALVVSLPPQTLKDGARVRYNPPASRAQGS
ncbi:MULTISPECIES: efflux RND transporter periplasmic adaptor subunit [unclassified Meiothermus]|uniref:efflux RND transporter periplasmic adaptor subunit n=1 Tax=unclassified Meiothermus TaxID=370471 RepID=UPI000D7BBC61|nr:MULTISPECIES: efflux RND transporter periplasmic adaptor subunit [unclassified Meiothermus]PZA07953.1 RND transporter [Meiothermus sp. Pnk-1]RYM36702.1 efflux RND transporter periplasmic adaptor subunit [Meiothermus sp. PNK-Is4]